MDLEKVYDSSLDLEKVYKVAQFYESKGFDWKIVRKANGYDFFLKYKSSLIFQELPSSLLQRIHDNLEFQTL